MKQLEQTFCRHNMVCDNPKGNGIFITPMPYFFANTPEIETEHTHVHPYYEIVWFQKGEGSHTVDFNEYPVIDNTVFFIAPGQVHAFDGNHNQKGLVIKVCTHLLNDGACTDSVLLKYNVFNTHDSVPFKHITPESAAILSRITTLIEEEAARPSDTIGHKDYLQSLIAMFIIQIERGQVAHTDTIFSTSRTAHRTFLAFRREIEHNYRTMHTVKEYATLLNVSTKTLTNYVNECSTHTPLEMINNRIILEAKRMLRYSDMMVKEIAAQLGFDDPSYFVKFFKRLVKASPADYRTPE